MAYQNVGTPRFFINEVLFYIKIGLGVEPDATGYDNIDHSIFELNPSHQQTVPQGFTRITSPVPNSINYVAWLGHDFATTQPNAYLWANGGLISGDEGNVNHPGTGFPWVAEYDGFSLQLFPETELTSLEVDFNPEGDHNPLGDAKIGSISIGKYYTMPHSPELKLTMTREMDGTKVIRTKGGNDLVNHRYTKPPLWGSAAPWELYSGTPTNQELSRSGRRSWDLRFNYLQDSDVFGANQSIGNYQSTAWGGYYDPIYTGGGITGGATDTFEGYDITDLYNTSTQSFGFLDNLLTGDNFFSQVIHKTHGGQLPFLFQPDNSNPDGFAIAKFDMNKFSFRQTAPNMYSVKLKIREIW